MRAADKLNLIENIGSSLQAKYTFKDVRAFLIAHNLKASDDFSVGSKRLYAKAILEHAPLETVLKIADELDLELKPAHFATLPQNWRDTADFRLFVSHISEHKNKATRLKSCLHPYGIDAFVAHEDIHPTLEWQQEIERALYTMDAFLAVHTPGFSKSNWTQQEVGFAIARGVKIVSLKMGEDPTGFISKHQALPRRDRTAEQIAEEIDGILSKEPTTQQKLEKAKDARSITPGYDDLPF